MSKRQSARTVALARTLARREKLTVIAYLLWLFTSALCGFFGSTGNDAAMNAAMIPAVLGVLVLFPLALLLISEPSEYALLRALRKLETV